MLTSTSARARFVRELRSLLRAPYPLIQLVTHEEERAVDTVAELAAKDGRPLAEWSPVRGFETAGDQQAGGLEGDGTVDPARALDRIANSDRPAVVVLKDLHQVIDDPAVVRRLREMANLVERRGGHADQSAHDEVNHCSLVWVGSVTPQIPELDVDLTRLRMPLPDREVVRRRCQSVFPSEDYPDLETDIMVSGALGLTARQADRAFRRVRGQLSEARERNSVLDVERAVLREKQRMIGESDLLEFHPLEVGLGDVGGMDALKSWLDEREEAFGEEARAYGLPMPKGMLLLGVQGCGKSLTAKAVARYWHMPLLRLDLGGVFDGRRSPEEAMRTAIDTAEAVSPCVLWMDEIEKGFVGDSEGRSQRVLGSLLTWQQEKDEPVFLVATANDVEKLPPELLRKGRFDEIFFIDLPERHEREDILQIHLQRRGRDMPPGVVEEIAGETEYFSGAELEQVVVGAMYAAFADEREPDADDLRYASEEIVPLYRTYEERIKALREWAQGRARSASHERQMLDYFE